jgi:hypothetical protein
MAVACAVVAFIGFAPTYWLLLCPARSPKTVVHIYGLLLFTWTLFFAVQTWVGASGALSEYVYRLQGK